MHFAFTVTVTNLCFSKKFLRGCTKHSARLEGRRVEGAFYNMPSGGRGGGGKGNTHMWVEQLQRVCSSHRTAAEGTLKGLLLVP